MVLGLMARSCLPCTLMSEKVSLQPLLHGSAHPSTETHCGCTVALGDSFEVRVHVPQLPVVLIAGQDRIPRSEADACGSRSSCERSFEETMTGQTPRLIDDDVWRCERREDLDGLRQNLGGG